MEHEHNTDQLCNDTSTKNPKNLRITCLTETLCTTPAMQTGIEASALITKLSPLTQSHSISYLTRGHLWWRKEAGLCS